MGGTLPQYSMLELSSDCNVGAYNRNRSNVVIEAIPTRSHSSGTFRQQVHERLAAFILHC